MLKSCCSDVEIPEVPIHQMIFDSIKASSDKVAWVDGDTEKEYTFSYMYDAIRRVASGLKRNGLQPRDIVAIISPNCVEYIIIFYATLACGAAVTTINPVYTTYEVSKQFQDCKPGFVFASPEAVQTAKEAAKQINLIQTIIISGRHPDCIALSDLMNDNGSLYPENTVTDVREHIATIPYSSGTTGLPKGVLLTHYNLVALFAMLRHPDIAKTAGMARDIGQIVRLSFVPFYHIYGLVALMIGGFLSGAKQIIMSRFVPERFLQLIEKYKVTSVPLVPPVIVLLVKSPLVKKYDLSSLEQVICGAAPLPEDVSARFLSLLKISHLIQAYGMTETAAVCAIQHGNRPVRLGSCGMLVPNMVMQIVDPQTMAVLGPNNHGELWVKGPNIMKGYLNKPEATREALDDNGWLHTGDIGYYDNDGYVYIMDRLKELIKYKGFQVAPAELEALILNHPEVDDVAVIGIPDENVGELPKAFIVRKPGSTLKGSDIMKYVADHVSPFKYLRGGVEFLNAIPKSQAGKILHQQLRQRMAQSKI